ncbi:MAG: lipid-A-disaccharide synthase [Candidatus Delongbacteria bacterium]|jgi:lipid-A-disaccharide synthase|nr:lipid-A-disaccharide synthase [Candidatus Delongbacteria bacterium]
MDDKLIYISAGEASGDLLGSEVIKELLVTDPYLKIKGIGGSNMMVQGLDPVFRTEEFGFMGFFEIFRHLFFIRKVLNTMVKSILKDKPKVVLLIDFSEFHIKLAKKLKKHNIKSKIIKYVSPQIWASRANRITDIVTNYDCLCCILPFEKEIYKDYHIDCRYVGHPLLDTVKIRYERDEFFKLLKISEDKKMISIFPGSRKQEISKHIDVILNTVRALKKERNDLAFFICKSENITFEAYLSIFKEEKIDIVDSVYQWELIKYSDIVLCKSGTSSMQTALMKTPSIIFYKLNSFSYFIAKRIIKTEYISLPNIIANKMIIPELMQGDFTVENIKLEVLKYLNDEDYYNDTIKELEKVSNSIGDKGAGKKVAEAVVGYLKR